MSLVARLVNEYYCIYNIRDNGAIYLLSKEYRELIKFPRDHKFNLYYRYINEADMDKHCCPNAVKRALKRTSIVWPTIMDHYKDINLDIDLLFGNKIHIVLMISRNIGFMHFKALLFKHNKYMKNRR